MRKKVYMDVCGHIANVCVITMSCVSPDERVCTKTILHTYIVIYSIYVRKPTYICTTTYIWIPFVRVY